VPLKGRTAKDVDFVVFRENTEGIYVGMGGQFKRGTLDEVAINEDVNTRKGVERIIRAAFEYAKAHGKKRLLMADKSNAMRHAHELWLRVFSDGRGPSTPRSRAATRTSTRCASTWCRIRRSST
jgi:3-isopropylmalate dehydrogenase